MEFVCAEERVKEFKYLSLLKGIFYLGAAGMERKRGGGQKREALVISFPFFCSTFLGKKWKQRKRMK